MPLRIGCEELRELARISNLLDVLDGIEKLLGTAAGENHSRESEKLLTKLVFREWIFRTSFSIENFR